MVDRSLMAVLSRYEDELLHVSKTGRLMKNDDRTNGWLFASRDPVLHSQIASTVLGDVAFDPALDDLVDVLQFEAEQHAEVLAWVRLFIRWIHLLDPQTVLVSCINATVDSIMQDVALQDNEKRISLQKEVRDWLSTCTS